MNARQRKFCEIYAIEQDATKAAQMAGYSEKTAYSIGSENLKKPELKKYIQTLQNKQSERLEIKADDITRFFQSVMNDDDARHSDRIKAAENLGKRIGYYEEDNRQKQINIPIEAWIKQNSE